MKQLLSVAVAIFMFASCKNADFEKAPSGLLYKIIPGNQNGAKLRAGQFIKMNIEFIMQLPGGKDSILNTTYGKVPAYSPIDTSVRSRYQIMEVLPKCRVGDSVACVISVDTLKNMGAIPDYTKAFPRGGIIHCNGRILKVFNSQPDVMADYQNGIKGETAKETADLQAYAAKKSWQVQTTKNGVLVYVQNIGDPKNMADTGKQVSIKYKGYLETTGEVFDTNMDTTKGHTQPIDIVLGRHQVIPGWEDGLTAFGKGGKGTMLVPAMLAYGPKGKLPAIPEYANLIFDVEILDVKPAPALPAGGGNSMHLTPQQMQQLQKQMQQQQQAQKNNPQSQH
jgi:FKBP-type peptidyl-prolyl cis-trans isomerase FkpA